MRSDPDLAAGPDIGDSIEFDAWALNMREAIEMLPAKLQAKLMTELLDRARLVAKERGRTDRERLIETVG